MRYSDFEAGWKAAREDKQEFERHVERVAKKRRPLSVKKTIAEIRDKPALVATNLPAGKELFADAGHSEDKDDLLAYAARCAHRPSRLEVVSAESVGLEWRFKGEKLPWGDEWRKTRWVCIYDKPQPLSDK